jgi:1-deoxy-D-xylulose-5-phosphate synthase
MTLLDAPGAPPATAAPAGQLPAGAGALRDLRGPADLRYRHPAELAALAEEIRRFLVPAVSATGGHLGSNLGVVELTIALHRVFDSPTDRILFDVGHQAYVHKLLTGRAAEFAALRRSGGLSGYPSRAESAHDVIENSHASTALSYADGLAKAYELRGETGRQIVAVVGDGALTGGMCWEALHNIGASERPVIVVLNDNGRSYGETIGSIAAHLKELRGGRPGPAGVAAWNLFEQMGFDYLGPVDGHDLSELEVALWSARAAGRPVVVHCLTDKGKGYGPAERDEADRLHGIGAADPRTGRPTASPEPTWTAAFGDELTRIGRRRDDVVAVTAAMLAPTGLQRFATEFPDRVFDVGIAEQHAVTSAAGLALGGLHPVVAVYATFLNRAFDQVLMDVALHRLPVTLVLDRAGVTGPDGASHHGMWDLSVLGLVPGLRIACPRDAGALRELLREAVDVADGPTAIRFPKASVGADIPAVDRVGGVDVLSTVDSADALLVAVGPLAPACLAAADNLRRRGIGVTVADPRWVAPVDPALVDLAARHGVVCTVEDNSVAGGAGSAIARACADAGVRTPVRTLGLPADFLAHGTRDELLARAGLDAAGIARAVQAAMR